MAGRTKRLGLSVVGGLERGSLVDDGQKYTSVDRHTIDAAFVQTEAHDHKFHPPASTGVATPTAIVATGGRLRGGQAFYYRVSMVEADGAEGVAGPEITVTLPALLVPPGPLATDMNETLPDPTGTLPPGLYNYALTALRDTEETTLGPALAVSVPIGLGGVRLALPPFGNADAVQLWRMHDSAAGFTRIAVIPEGTTSFHDDGSVPADPCACDPGNLPPTANVGASNYAIEITLPAGITPTGGGWRIYRSSVSGRYITSSLVHLVTELNDENDLGSGVVKSWVDVGDPLQLGMPQDTLIALRFQPYVFDGAVVLPDPTGYPELYPFMLEGVLHVLIGGQWEVVGAGSSGDGGAVGPAVLTSPNGTRWIQTVSDAGASVMVETQMPGPSTPPQNVTVS